MGFVVDKVALGQAYPPSTLVNVLLMFHHCPLPNPSSIIKAQQHGQLTAWLNNTLKNAVTDCETLMHEVILPHVLNFLRMHIIVIKKVCFCVNSYNKFQ